MEPVKEYEEIGYVVKEFDFASEVSRFRKEILSIFDLVARHNGLAPIKTDQDVVDLYRGPNNYLWKQAHSVVEHLPIQNWFAGNATLLEFVGMLGIQKPVFTSRHEVRVDMPNDLHYGKRTIHQDGVYSRGSKRSLVVWIPLQDTDKEIGAVCVVPRTHQFGLLPNKNGIIYDFPEKLFIDKEMKCGEVLFLSQFTVHRSGHNIKEGAIRMSIQIRMTDLSDPDYIEAGYPIAFEWKPLGSRTPEKAPEFYENSQDHLKALFQREQ